MQDNSFKAEVKIPILVSSPIFILYLILLFYKINKKIKKTLEIDPTLNYRQTYCVLTYNIQKICQIFIPVLILDNIFTIIYVIYVSGLQNEH